MTEANVQTWLHLPPVTTVRFPVQQFLERKSWVNATNWDRHSSFSKTQAHREQNYKTQRQLMFWCSRHSDGCKAVSGWLVSAVMQASEQLLFSWKQSDLVLPVPPAHALVLQHSPSPWHRSSFLQETSAHLAAICHPRPKPRCVPGRALPSCLLPPVKGRSFHRLSSFCEITGQCGMDAALFDWLGYWPFAVVFTQLLFLPPLAMTMLPGLTWTSLVPA